MKRVDGRGKGSADLSDARVDELEEGRPSTKLFLGDLDFECDGFDEELMNKPVRGRKVGRQLERWGHVDCEETRSEEGTDLELTRV